MEIYTTLVSGGCVLALKGRRFCFQYIGIMTNASAVNSTDRVLDTPLCTCNIYRACFCVEWLSRSRAGGDGKVFFFFFFGGGSGDRPRTRAPRIVSFRGPGEKNCDEMAGAHTRGARLIGVSVALSTCLSPQLYRSSPM